MKHNRASGNGVGTSDMSNNLMAGKRGLIMGLANDKSIAWGIAKACADAGAEMAFSYMGDAFKKRVAPLAEQLGVEVLIDCDVGDPASIDAAFAEIEAKWGKIDFLVHAIGFSDKNELRGRYVDTSRDNFMMTMDISVYSFTAVAQRAEKIMNEGGSMLTLTYYGAEQVMPHYNVMGVAKAALEASVKYMAEDLGKDGIRVNAISAGPIKTLAASGIGDFRYILKWNEYNSPLRRNVTIDDVGKSALYLLSDLGSGVTGENLHVDAGYHVVGMKAVDAPDIDAGKKVRPVELTHLLAFNLTLLAALVSPGPAMLVALRTTITQGRRAGILTGLGLAVAAALWTGLALAGLDVIFRLFPWAYLTLKLLGAAYLIYLAIGIWRSAHAPLATQAQLSRKGAVLNGLLVNLSNPKSMLFASAVLVVIFPRDMSLAAKALIIGNHLVVEVVAYSLFALMLSTRPARDGYLRLKPALDRIAALVLGALGLRLLFSK